MTQLTPRCLLLVLIFSCIALAQSGDLSRAAAPLEAKFSRPADDDKPWAYWWWVNGNVTEQSITRDMEAMKQAGFGGLLMFDSRNYHDDILPPPPPRMPFMSPAWRKLLKHSIAEADRLGLGMSVNLSSGAGALKGPWDVGDQAPKKLSWTRATIDGPRRVRCMLDEAEGRWNIAVIAARHAEAEADADADADADASNQPAGEANLSDNWQAVSTKLGDDRVVEVIDLTDHVNNQGQLDWQAPAGRWSIIRFTCSVMEGHEKDVDILSDEAVEAYFHRMAGRFIEDAGDAARQTLTHLYSVSWEGATPTWTFKLESEFKKLRGYDMRPWLPILAGMPVDSADVSERFLRDYYRTLSDCFMLNCYGKLEQLTHAAGLTWHSESGGPWHRKLPSFQHADQLAFLGRNDMPQGEFWYPYRGLNRQPAMAAHIYGKPLVATEAFTHMKHHWSVYPARLKPCADAAFVEGANQFIWHTFTASPPEFGKPGIEYFAGSHLNPNVTWWEQSHVFLTYLARCQTLLREGRFVADICAYVGDEPYLHWGPGEQWSKKPTLKLDSGYTFDMVNTEVLLQRLAVKDSRLVLPDGMSYGLLVVDLDDQVALPGVLRRVVELAQAGATVVLGQRRPMRAPGLRDYPDCDDAVRKLVEQLWGKGDSPATQTIGKGQVITNTPVHEVLTSLKIPADFEGPFRYIHRRSDDTDIYFVAGEGEADCTFRVTGKTPELWDPQSGQVQPAGVYRQTADGRTVVPLNLPEGGSTFVVFRKPADQPHLTNINASNRHVQIHGRTSNGLSLTCWQNGDYQLQTSNGAPIALSVKEVHAPQPLTGPWQVSFTPGWGAPESVTFDQLIAWNDHPDQGIKYYSGSATYRITFELSADQARGPIRLDLGEVHNVAEVNLNGKPLGIAWTAPWDVDLTGAAKPGSNQLLITVTNTWVNRLIGDAHLPPDKRYTQTNVTGRVEGIKFPHLRGYGPEDPLMKSGLLGPVKLHFGVDKQIKWPQAN
ncbi:hypothetical protein HED60_18300 [Planctomycetales bacterium ZRK34]|nr:hypothetical protein HED60_18300 [Planctomycetales bacterium ZRK34]